MKLYATTTSERASKGQGGNEYIIIDLNVHREDIGQVELWLNNDTKDGYETDEWVLQYRRTEENDWNIFAQGNITPPTKAEKKKAEQTYPQAQDNCEHLYRDASDKRFCVDCGKKL